MDRKYELFGQKLAYCREKIEFSKKDMAGMIGVSPSTYSKYEKGLSMPSVDTLYIISLISDDMLMESFIDP